MLSRSLSVRTIVKSKTYIQTNIRIVQYDLPKQTTLYGELSISRIEDPGSFTLEDRTFCLSVRFRFSDRTHILWPWRLSTWPQNDLSKLFQCNCLCRLLLWPNCFSLDILLFRHILFLEQEQTEIFFFVGYLAYQIELILEHAGPTKGVYSEQRNQGHEKPKKPKSFQKWQKYGFIKLKFKVHPLVTFYFRVYKTIFTSDDRILYDHKLTIWWKFQESWRSLTQASFPMWKIFIYWPRYCLFTSWIPSLETRSDLFDIFIILTFFRTGLRFT